MRKFLHMAGGIAKKTLATAAKLAKKLAHIVLQAARRGGVRRGQGCEGPVGQGGLRRGQKGAEVHSAGVQGRDDRVRRGGAAVLRGLANQPQKIRVSETRIPQGDAPGRISLKQSPAFPAHRAEKGRGEQRRSEQV